MYLSECSSPNVHLWWVFVFLDPRSLKYCKNKFMNKAITCSRLNLFKIKTLYLFNIFKKLFREMKLWCPK